MHKYILDSEIDAPSADVLSKILGEFDAVIEKGFTQIDSKKLLDHQAIRELSSELGIDLNTLPEGFNPKEVRLVISDMDSTFINIECIDEIADFAGKKAEVSQVTEAAMRGELDFAQSLTQRVALLEGLPVDVLDKVYDERLQLNPGGQEMLTGLKGSAIRFALVSGGFTHFTNKLKARYQLDYARANTLEIESGKLRGKVSGAIVDGKEKRRFLESLCEELGITGQQVVAVGDGANDLLMMEVAGLGIAYHAKPKVQQQASCAINLGGLDGILSLLGIAKPN